MHTRPKLQRKYMYIITLSVPRLLTAWLSGNVLVSTDVVAVQG